MRTIITSNSWPLRRALCTLLLGIAAPWAMPGSALGENGSVSEYDATTGAAINANFITGLDRASVQLALLGNNLFVANFADDTVGKYDATTGAAINANFITGLNRPQGLALSGNILYVANTGIGASNNTVVEYDATTGATINANFITGLNRPDALGLSGNILFVENNLFVANGVIVYGTVGEYNATTGAAINANFITGLEGANRLALSGNNLFVANFDNDTVGKYDATTGAAINANLISTEGHFPNGLALTGNNLFVANGGFGASNNTIGEYNATTGATINANFITGLSGLASTESPTGLALSGNNLFVANVVEAPVPEPSTWAMIAMGGAVLLGIMRLLFPPSRPRTGGW